MIELDRHIEILLLSNDCVIIPGLGGFMAHHVCACYDEKEHLFLPPLRTLGFNPQLKMNDSLLVQSYVEAYDLSYPEALRRIEDEVEELKQHLENEGKYELNDIGLLSVNDDGKYIFTPCEAGILTPELYGLGTFEMLSHKAAAPVVAPPAPTVEEPQEVTISPLAQDTEDVQAESPVDEEDEERALVIKMSWIRNAVAVAAALLVFFLMSTPVVNSDVNNRTMSNLNNSILFPKMPKDSNMEKITIDKKAVDKVLAKSDTMVSDTLKKVPDLTVSEDVKTGYCIVLASYVSQKNADAFVARLQKQGYEDSEVFLRKNVRRVIYGNFKTINEAYNQLNRINHKKDFEEAWVMKL